jgi:hypothetical protein
MNLSPKNNLINEMNFESNRFINNEYVLNNGTGTANCNSLLVSRKIDNYFNELISKPEPQKIPIVKNDYTFAKFYDEYIEHNILLLFIILGLIIFLLIKYFNKYYYTENLDNLDNDTNLDDDLDTNINTNANIDAKNKKKIKNKKSSVISKKEELELDKQSILDIIDELSSMNYKKIEKNNKIIELNKTKTKTIMNNNHNHNHNHNPNSHNPNHHNNNLNNYNDDDDYDDYDDYNQHHYSSMNTTNVLDNPYISTYNKSNILHVPDYNHVHNLKSEYQDEPQYKDYLLLNNNGVSQGVGQGVGQGIGQGVDQGISNSDAQTDGFGDGYLNINKNIDYKNKKNKNNIRGVYIESPYEE